MGVCLSADFVDFNEVESQGCVHVNLALQDILLHKEPYVAMSVI